MTRLLLQFHSSITVHHVRNFIIQTSCVKFGFIENRNRFIETENLTGMHVLPTHPSSASTEKTSKDSKNIGKIVRNCWQYVVLPSLCNTKINENKKKAKPVCYLCCGLCWVWGFFFEHGKVVSCLL